MLEKRWNTETFIGRSAEIATFKSWFADPQSPWILYIHDAAEEIEKKGGVGKTLLMQKYAELIKREYSNVAVVMIDFFNIGDRGRIFLAEKIVAGAQELYPSWTPSAFLQAIANLRAEKERSEPETTWNNEISAALADDLRRLDTSLAQEQKTLLVFFDTFEAIEQDAHILVLRPAEKFPDTYHFTNMRAVIAGRNRLDWTHTNWQGREQEVQTLPLSPFDRQEMLEYIDSKSVLSIKFTDEEAKALHERTDGRPIIIGLAIDVLNNRLLTLPDLLKISRAEFERDLVFHINQLENPINWVILFMAHVYHRFNQSILEWILTHVTAYEPVASISRERLAAILPTLSFIRRPGSGEDFVLHDEMRRLVIKHCWDRQDTDQRLRKEISQSMVAYYEQMISLSHNEREKQSLTVEMFYHRLFMNLNEGFDTFRERFNTALGLSQTAFARLLWQEAQRFTPSLSAYQRGELQFAEAHLLRTEENPETALTILNRLARESDSQWVKDNPSRRLLETARCYQRLSKLSEASLAYEQCLEVERTVGDELWQAILLRSLGNIAWHRGQFSIALDYCEQSLALYKKLGNQREYAATLTAIGRVYRIQGKIQEALRVCRVAWRIRQELFQAGEVSAVTIGQSSYALGKIYLQDDHILEADRYFHEVLDIYQRVNYKAGIATIHNCLGEVQLQKGELGSALEWFVQAQQEAHKVDTEQYINSLHKQGRVHALQNQWEQAKAFFTQAAEIASQVPDFYQQTENLIDLAKCLEQLEEHEFAKQNLQQAETIASEANYLSLLGAIAYQRGEKEYAAQTYDRAFQYFAVYCRYKAQYNTTEYITALQKVTDSLLDIPRKEAQTIVKDIIQYWKTEQLDQEYPDFVEAFENVGELMNI